MILKRVKLKNFISHANTEIEFPLGVTAIVGPNGAGKTSIVDAIVFALFGDKVRGERVEDLIRRGASSAEVELTFEAGKDYTVRWIRRKRSVEVTLSRSDVGVIANTKDAVLEETSKILKMDKESAMNSIFIRQGEIASLVDADPRTRKNLLGKLIGLDRLEKAWERMREVISHFEDIKSKLEGDIQGIEGELKVRKEQRSKLEKEIENLKAEIGNLERKLMDIEGQLKVAKSELEKWDEKKRKYDSLIVELTKIGERIKAAKGKIEGLEKELKQSEEAKKRLKELEPEIAKIPLLEEYSEKLCKLNNLVEEKDQLKKDLDKILDIRNEAKESMKSCRDYVEAVEVEEVEGIQEELSEIEKFITRISTQVSSIVKQIKNNERELRELISKALEVLPEATAKAKDAKLQELKARREELDAKISELKDERGRVRGRISDLRQALEMLGEADTCPVCRTKLTPEHRERVKDEIQREIESLKEDLKKIEKEIKEHELQRKEVNEEIERVSKIDVERIERLEKEIAKDKEELAKLYKNLHTVVQRVNNLEDKIKSDLSDADAKIKEIEENLNDLTEKIGYKPEDPEKDLKELGKKKEEYDRLKPIADKYEEIAKELGEERERLEKLEAKKKRIQKEVEELGYDEKRHKEVRENYEKLVRKFEHTKAELEEKRKSLGKKQEDLKKENKRISKLEDDLSELRTKFENVVKFITKLNNIRSAFSRDGVQKMLRQRIAPLISEFARNYLERFNLDITDISVSEDFDISVIKEGGEISIKSISGGEKVAVAIALRLAIAKALAGKISTIIMDEPTTHLDEERRRELVEIMKSFFREGATIPQMIIVTHHRELEDVADTVYRAEKVSGVSRIIAEV